MLLFSQLTCNKRRNFCDEQLVQAASVQHWNNHHMMDKCRYEREFLGVFSLYIFCVVCSLKG